MATVNLTIAARGNHPRGRKPYMIQNIIDLAVATASKGTALASADVYQCLNIPAESVILHAGLEVTALLTGTSTDTLLMALMLMVLQQVIMLLLQ
jgi:hypothetical protein